MRRRGDRRVLESYFGGGSKLRKRLSVAALLLVAGSLLAQSGPPEKTPSEVIEGVWSMAASGEILTEHGWKRVSGYFLEQNKSDQKEVIVMSGYFGLTSVSEKKDVAEVIFECERVGTIDRKLRFTAAPPPKAYKSGIAYRLSPVSRHIIWYDKDGKKVRVQEVAGTRVWQIDGPPGPRWTTVNTAIRYVLEERKKASDPIVKKNADETIKALMTFDPLVG
jgi:hypothetical protein